MEKRRLTDQDGFDPVIHRQLADKIGRIEFQKGIDDLRNEVNVGISELSRKVDKLTDLVSTSSTSRALMGQESWWKIITVFMAASTISAALVILSINSKVDPVKTALMDHVGLEGIHQSINEKIIMFVPRNEFDLYNKKTEQLNNRTSENVDKLAEIVRAFQFDQSGVDKTHSANIEELFRILKVHKEGNNG